VENDLRWAEVWSYSTRRQRESPISGLLGAVALRAEEWSPFWPSLLWGQFTHVGKDAMKGSCPPLSISRICRVLPFERK
jgi:hypothetical protein